MEKSLQLCIAGIDLEVTGETDALMRFCRDYPAREPGKTPLSLCVDGAAIEAERQIGRESGRGGSGTDAYLSTLALCRNLCEHLPEYDAMLFHASALSIGGEAYLFAAPSGTGKSTHAALWRQVFPGRVTMINDDKPILRRVNGIWMACGSPWNGKHRLSENRMDPICGICVLRRGAENAIKRIDPASAMPILYGQIQRLRGEAAMERQMTLLSDLICRIPLYEMHCQPTPEAARMAYTAMVGGTV